MLAQLKSLCPAFAGGRAGRRLAGRFTRTIHVVEVSRGNWETHWASLVFRAGTGDR